MAIKKDRAFLTRSKPYGDNKTMPLIHLISIVSFFPNLL